jgi:hypothetical protein
MKTLRWLIPMTLVVMALSIGGAVVSAAGTDPVGAPYADNTAHTIAPNAILWYRFEYDGSHSQITIRLVNGKDDGLRFEVYSPTQMQEWWKDDSIGVGSPEADDLVWSGNAHEGGTWFIKLMNDKGLPATFELNVTGEDVSFTPPSSVPVQAPKVIVPAFENIEPTKALLVDSTEKVIPANSTLWYRFAYDGTYDQATLKIPNGWENRLRMHVHTPSQITKWWSSDVKPIGQGTPNDKDLVWSGKSNEPGWWYVEVMNDNPYDVGFGLNLDIQEAFIRPD